MVYNLTLKERKEITDFLKEKFNIVADEYNEEEINNVLIEINKILSKKIKEEEIEYDRLRRKYESDRMLLDAYAYDD